MSVTPNFSWPLIEPTDFVTNLPADLETLADDIDADVWAIKGTADAAIPKTLIDAAGDLIYGSAADTAARLAIGTAGQVLQVSGGGLPTWDAPPASGYTWTRRLNHTTSDEIHTIAYNGTNLYVAAGQNGFLATSPDGLTWTSRTSGFGSNRIFKVAFGNGLWVAVGGAGTITTSTDGITWTARTSNMSTNDINDVIYKNSLWVAVGNGGGATNTGGITSSTDGLTWSRKSQSLSVGTTYGSVDYNGTNWVVGATQSSGNNALWAATPSGTWTAIATGTGTDTAWLKCDGTNTFWSDGTDYYVSSSATLGSPTTIANVKSMQQSISNGTRRNVIHNNQIYKALYYLSNFSTTITNSKALNSTTTLLPTTQESQSSPWITPFFGCIFVGAAGVIIGSNRGEIYTSFQEKIMAYTFTVDDDYKVIVKQGSKKIDEVGAFESKESGEYWAGEMTKYYEANPTHPYPIPSELPADDVSSS